VAAGDDIAAFAQPVLRRRKVGVGRVGVRCRIARGGEYPPLLGKLL